jgi:hypothetical protein
MAFTPSGYNATSPVAVGSSPKKSQWDVLWTNITAMVASFVTWLANVDPALPLGVWTSVAFNSGDYTGGGGTWTVSSGNVKYYRYQVIGKTMFLTATFDSTTVGAGLTELRLAMPGGYTVANDADDVALVGFAYEWAVQGTSMSIFTNHTNNRLTIQRTFGPAITSGTRSFSLVAVIPLA